MEELDRVERLCIQRVNDAKKELQDYADKDPEVKEFLEILFHRITSDDYLKSSLETLLWQIAKIDSHSCYPGVLNDICSFISNYQYDDSYFYIYKKRCLGKEFYYVRNKIDSDPVGVHHLKDLIIAAKHNCAMYKELDKEQEE